MVLIRFSIIFHSRNGITHTGYTEGTAQDAIPIFGMNLNVVTQGYGYDLEERIPILKSENNSLPAIELETA